jgi:coproporphyrinogen III oxidase-like Fe-S oxidoreductase
MPPSHQRNTAQHLGGGHAGHSATNLADTSNRARFVLTVSESRAGILGRVTSSAPSDVRLTPGTAFGIYVHVPFCATRCGYCDFNTYTAGELGGATPQGWLAAVAAELAMAADVVGEVTVDTVFVGGGTPSLLGGDGLAAVLDVVLDNFALAAGAEVTTEANPESTSPEFFERIRAAGYTRVSLGMQSAAPAVLKILDRTHSPGRAAAAAAEALAAGFEHLNLDLIYGTPGESDDDLSRSVDTALSAGVDHVSAYALVVEDGTALARRVNRGEIARPDDDVLAHRYELLDSRLSAAGTTSATGTAASGGVPGPVRTASWEIPGGGTSSTPTLSPSGLGSASRRPPTSNASRIATATSRTCCCASGCTADCLRPC